MVLKTYFDDPTFSDLTLRLSDRSVSVHRVVLCRESEYFNSLTGHFKETDAKGVELHEVYPLAIIALLHHIYKQPYRTNGNEKWPVDLDSHIDLYMTAGKYLIRQFQVEVLYRLRSLLVNPRNGGVISDVPEFMQGLRKIIALTTSDDMDRKTTVRSCILNLRLLRKDQDFMALLKDFGGLGGEIIRHEDLERGILGSWMCSRSCDPLGSIPWCSNCTQLFETEDAWEFRDQDMWYCYDCEEEVAPTCQTCHESVVWIQEFAILATAAEAFLATERMCRFGC